MFVQKSLRTGPKADVRANKKFKKHLFYYRIYTESIPSLTAWHGAGKNSN